MPSKDILTISGDLIQILSQLTYLDDLRGGCEVCVAAYLCGFVAPGPVCVVAAVWSLLCFDLCGTFVLCCFVSLR